MSYFFSCTSLICGIVNFYDVHTDKHFDDYQYGCGNIFSGGRWLNLLSTQLMVTWTTIPSHQATLIWSYPNGLITRSALMISDYPLIFQNNRRQLGDINPILRVIRFFEQWIYLHNQRGCSGTVFTLMDFLRVRQPYKCDWFTWATDELIEVLISFQFNHLSVLKNLS